MTDVTQILEQVEAGQAGAREQLFEAVYSELRRMAAGQMAKEQPGQTLQPTALVHEAYMRLAGNQPFDNRCHFFAAAGEAMRRVLVDNARRKLSAKRGGSAQRVPLSEVAVPDEDERLVALDEQLTQFALDHPLAARVVELHHFVGLSYEQVAEALDITIYEVRLKWAFARAWLKAALENS
jgi:RNA polymerase sigma factor (TIGR02999 family)